jgi:lysophospholipase L1-like esterase
MCAENSNRVPTAFKIFLAAGWGLFLALAILVTPHLYQRLFMRLPAAQAAAWRQTVEARCLQVATDWQDARPLILLAGDSQIEYGNWYDLFAGHWAVRNTGLARAKITDVTALVNALGDRRPRAVVLMCGSNNLFAQEPVESCEQDYEKLLAAVRARLEPEQILVLSVMPLRASPVDRTAQAVNAQIADLNRRLAGLCRQTGAEFVDVCPAVTEPGGGLAPQFTTDGLHLNPSGYHQLAVAVAGHLAP